MPPTVRDSGRILSSKTASLAPLAKPRKTKTAHSLTLMKSQAPEFSTKPIERAKPIPSSSLSSGSFSSDSLGDFSSATDEEINIEKAISDTSCAKGSIIKLFPRTPETLVCNTRVTDDTTTISSVDSIDGKPKDPQDLCYCKGKRHSDKSQEQSESDNLAHTTNFELNKNRKCQPICHKPQSQRTVEKTKPVRNGMTPKIYLPRFPAGANVSVQKKPLETKNPLPANRKINIPSSCPRKDTLKEQVNEPNGRTKTAAPNLKKNNQQRYIPKNKIPLSYFHDPKYLPKLTNVNSRQNNTVACNVHKKTDKPLKYGPRKSFTTDIEIFMPRLSVSKNNVVYKSSKVPSISKRETCPEKLMMQKLDEKEENSAKDIETLLKFPAVKVSVTRTNDSRKHAVKEIKENVNTEPPKTSRKAPINKLASLTRGQVLPYRQFSIKQGQDTARTNPIHRKETMSRRASPYELQKIQKPAIAAPVGKLRPAQRPLTVSPVYTSLKALNNAQHRPFPVREKKEKNAKRLLKSHLQPKILSTENVKENDHFQEGDCSPEDKVVHSMEIEDLAPQPVSRKSWSMNEFSRVQKKVKKRKTYKELYLEQKAVRDSGLAAIKEKKQMTNEVVKKNPKDCGTIMKTMDSLNENANNGKSPKKDTRVQAKSKKQMNNNFLLYNIQSSKKKCKGPPKNGPKKKSGLVLPKHMSKVT